jgi:hypothetical protein
MLEATEGIDRRRDRLLAFQRKITAASTTQIFKLAIDIRRKYTILFFNTHIRGSGSVFDIVT